MGETAGPPRLAFENKRSKAWLLGAAVIFSFAWLLGLGLVAPALRAPTPWTQIGGAATLVTVFVAMAAKTPLRVEFASDALSFHHLFRTRVIPRECITRVEYRLLVEYAAKPVDLRYYGVSLWQGTKRIADVGLDGPIAEHLMSWFDSSRSTLRIYRGRELVEERPLEPRP